MNRIALTVLLVGVVAACASGGVDGIAVSTHRKGGGDGGFGVGRAIFGDIVRHDIKNSKVVKRTALYQGKARCAVISQMGDKVAFVKLDGHLCVINMDGTGFKELKNTKNHNASWLDWPVGDWVYYVEEGSAPDGVFNPRQEAQTDDKKTIRRVNVLTGEDEKVGMAFHGVWQLSLTALANKDEGKFVITSVLSDFSNPSQKLNTRGLACGTVVSPSGKYVTESHHTHSDFRIWNWDLDTIVRELHVNQWAPDNNDGRKYIYRPRWSVNSDKWIVLNNGNDFGCTVQTNMVLYNWIDGEQIQVTNNSVESGECDEADDFWLAGISNELGIGLNEGKAPYTVQLGKGALEGKWSWDFGDGAKLKAPVGTHTYAKAGSYTVSARQGKRVLTQSISVLEPTPPRVASVDVLDVRSIMITFGERIQLKNPKVTLASTGAAAKSVAINMATRSVRRGVVSTGGRSVIIELQDDLVADDELIVEGVLDTAQRPNPIAPKAIPILVPAWPSRRAGLTFLWQTDNEASFQYDGPGKPLAGTQMSRWSRAKHDRNGAMLLKGGVFFALEGGQGAYSECVKANRFSIEAVITPANEYQGWRDEPRWIVSCNTGGRTESVNVMIAQEGDKAVLYFKQKASPSATRVEMCTITDQAPNHIIAGYEPGNLTCYLNGKLVVHNTEVNGELNWRNPGFTTGMSFGGSQVVTNDMPFRKEFDLPWRGKIEGVALYSRALSSEEAGANFAAYDAILKARPTTPRITLRGKLLAKTEVPDLKDIAPYRDALVVHEYEVEKILKGTYAPKKIRVARWGLLDARPSAVAREKPGESVALVVEPLKDHPQLEAAVLQNTLDENFDLDLYYDVANGPTGEPYLAVVSVLPREIWIPPNETIQYRVLARDQYGNPIKAPIKWSVLPGGHINAGMFYSGGSYLEHRGQKGSGSITDTGLLTTDGDMGIITIQAASAADPSTKGAASAAVDEYPAISPHRGAPLHIGGDSSGKIPFIGDIDRIRIYNRALSAEQIAAHAEGKAFANEDLVGDWTFDKFENGVFVNSAGGGMAGKIVGAVEHVPDGDGGHIRMPGPLGYVEVKHDNRLNFSQTATLEAWIRPKGNGGIVMDKSSTGAVLGFRLDCAGGLRAKGMHGWLQLGHRHPADTWTHLVVTYQRSGVWKGYANGKFIGERKRRVIIVRQ